MSTRSEIYYRQYEAVAGRLKSLAQLRKMVGLPPEYDIGEGQWLAIGDTLTSSSRRLLDSLKSQMQQVLSSGDTGNLTYRVNTILAAKEVEAAKAFSFFDTYLDVLSQRHIPMLGRLLAGCDALALDALHRNHPSLNMVGPPLVYCDRGIGASTIREGVMMPDRSANPLPLIQIPYTRLQEKYNLTSILHEVGHEAMVRLGLKNRLPMFVKSALQRAGAPTEIQNLYGLWMSEIGPDFWAFGASGLAAAGAVREVLAFPAALTFRLSWADPHPPAYLRALLHFEWCREIWGQGIWDDWDIHWRTCYPLSDAPTNVLPMLRIAEKFIPVVSKVLLYSKLEVLNGKPILSLFDVEALHPAALEHRMNDLQTGKLNLKGLSPAAQLAVFRLIKEKQLLPPTALDELMQRWLVRLGNQKNHLFKR